MHDPARGSGSGHRRSRTHPSWQAAQISTHIQDALSRPAAGRVLHVFTEAAYLSNGEEDVVSLVSQALGPGPLAVVLDSIPARINTYLAPGEPVTFGDGAIRTPRLSIGLESARPWPARPAWASLRPAHARLRASLPELQETLLACAPPDCLAAILDRPRSSGGLSQAMRFVDEVRQHSSAFLAALDATLQDPPASSPTFDDLRGAVGNLAGLGGGFTPAGDDFLVGAIFAIWSSKPSALAQLVSTEIASAAGPRTTTVSAAYLRAAAEGAAGAPWHRLVDAIVFDKTQSKREAVQALAGVGHTSGADALTGYLLALPMGLAHLP